MSGEIIVKRKRDEQFGAHTAPASETEADSSIGFQNTERENENSTSLKRPCPAVVEASISEPCPDLRPNARNELLLEALQRIVELQNELDEFEQDLDEHESYRQHRHQDEDANFSMYDDEAPALRLDENIVNDNRRSEAEALGFAMCARETLLFLQREGISTDSFLYRSLRSKLLGQTDGFIPI